MSKNFKAGIVALITLVAFFVLVNYLKGTNIFNSGTTLYAVYDDVSGLLPTRPVIINGLKVGMVTDIRELPTKGKMLVEMEVDTDFVLTNQAVAVISESIMGDASLKINISKEGKNVKENDTIQSMVAVSITDIMQEKLYPVKEKLEKMMVSIDSTLISVQSLLTEDNKQNIAATLVNLKKATESFQAVSGDISKLATSTQKTVHKADNVLSETQQLIKNNAGNIDQTLTNFSETSKNLNSISHQLNEVDYQGVMTKMDQSLSSLNEILAKIEKGEGTLGKLTTDEQLYNNLTRSTKELELLLRDLKENPKRYVHFSVFSKKDKPYEGEQSGETP